MFNKKNKWINIDKFIKNTEEVKLIKKEEVEPSKK